MASQNRILKENWPRNSNPLKIQYKGVWSTTSMHVPKWHGRLCQSQPHSLLRIHTHQYFNHFDSLIFTVGVWSTHPGCLIYEHNIWHSSLPLTHLFHVSPRSFFCEAHRNLLYLQILYNPATFKLTEDIAFIIAFV